MGRMDTYRINEPTVIHQTIGGETVIIHLSSGLYYSLEGSGADIWDRLNRGVAPTAVAEELATGSASDRDTIIDEIDAFVTRLVEEDLLLPVPDSNGVAPGAPGEHVWAPTSGPETPVGPYRAPKLARYDDLQDLLLLDPIHATDASGWPERSPVAEGVGADGA